MKSLTKKQVKEYVRIHIACQTFHIGFNCQQLLGENDVENIENEIYRFVNKNIKDDNELLTTTDDILNYVRKHF